MKNIIGIRGHRGAGKESVAYLLATTLEFIDSSEELEVWDEESRRKEYDLLYETAVESLVRDKDGTLSNHNFKKVYLDAFGDAPKAMVQQLLGCDFKYLWDEWWKDHAIVDLKTFDVIETDNINLEEYDVVSISYIDNYAFILNTERHPYMMLRDFILYFGQNVMQKYFGADVWVKSTSQNDKRNTEFFEDGFRIYTDIKAPTELSYVIGRGGVIVKVERNGYKKKGGLDLLNGDDRWDYEVKIKGNDLMSIKDDILKIAEKIYFDNE